MPLAGAALLIRVIVAPGVTGGDTSKFNGVAAGAPSSGSGPLQPSSPRPLLHSLSQLNAGASFSLFATAEETAVDTTLSAVVEPIVVGTGNRTRNLFAVAGVGTESSILFPMAVSISRARLVAVAEVVGVVEEGKRRTAR